MPRGVKKDRLNALLSLTGDLSAEVHSEYKGKIVDVFVEKISPQSTKNQVELKWAEDRVQLSGRTAGDLICVFDVEKSDAAELVGEIVQVEILDSGPLLLKGKPLSLSVSK